MTTAEASTDAAVASPLALTLDLSEDELDLLQQLFEEFATALGLNGKAVFQKLRRGHSIGTALDLPKGTNELLYDRAYKWISAGRSDKAEPLFRALCILDSRDANYQIGYAVCLRYRGKLGQAKTAIERAISLRPDWPIARFHAMQLFARIDDWPRVAAELKVFDSLPGDGIPEILLQEIARFRFALDMHRLNPGHGGDD